MHVEPQWVNKHLLLLLIKDKRREPKVTPCLAALVKHVIELRDTSLQACHYAEEFTLQWIHPLDRWEKLAYECPWLVDPRREPITGKIFNFTCYCR
jgi:hypothetical protein